MNDYIHKQLTRRFKSMIDSRIFDIKTRKEIHEKTLLSLKNKKSNYVGYGIALSSKSDEIMKCKSVISSCNSHIIKLLYIKSIIRFCNLQRVCACLTKRSYTKMTQFELSLYLIVGNTWIYKPNLRNISFTDINMNTDIELNVH